MKGLIQIFLVLLILVSLLQVFYMLPTRKVETAAEDYAEQYVATHQGEDAYEARKKARATYLDSISGDEIFRLPGIGGFTYSDLKGRQLAMGLDLKGGMSSVLQVDLREMLENYSRDSKDEAFVNALNQAEAEKVSSQSDFISLFGQAYSKQPNKKKLAYIFRRSGVLEEKINTETSDGEVLRILGEEGKEVVKTTFKMLKERINKLGVAQPNVTLDENRALILVEMPGIENPERAREFLNASAALEFWDTYRNSDNSMLSKFYEADNRLKTEAGMPVETTPQVTLDTIWTQSVDSLGNMTGDSTFQIVERQADQTNLNQGPLLNLFTVNDGRGDMIGGATVMGFAEKNKRKAVSALLERSDIKTLFPVDSKFMWSRAPYSDRESGDETNHYMLHLLKVPPGNGDPLIEGDVIKTTSHSPDPVTGEMTVNLSMNSDGSKRWADMSTKAANAGNREVAICIDGEVISAPSVNGPITGGRTQITGDFSIQEASDFASLLAIGKLPAGVRTIQESTVGPSLGKKNINSSLTALAVGFGLILLFMVLYYSGAGFISILALLLNMFFIFGALASFGTVLTLPGIAGIVLTIGMAVDANVIIYERIREELRAGKNLLASINDGFRHSYSAIIDANVTTLLVAGVLAYFGLGPIKGFAVVLIIGVLASLFTAVLIGRMLIDWWTQKGNNLGFWTGASKNAFANLKIDWLGKKTIAWICSGLIIVAGLGSMAMRGFDLGVDFKGGYSYNVEFPDGTAVNKQSLEQGLTTVFGAKPVVKAVNTKNTYNIVTDYLVDDNSEEAANNVIKKLHEGVAAISGSSVSFDKFKLTDAEGVAHVISSSKVGPTIAEDIKTSSLYAGIFALLLIFLYIFIRFNKWQFSLGAVAALAHDTLVVLSIFSLLHGILPFSMEIDQAFIAAILTVIGYSINDTVVLFDRIREFLGIYPKKDTDSILNMAINSTFSRTIITSITTLIMITPLFIFGGGSIKGFAFALIVGIIVGTYSSIFIATPIVRQLSTDLKPKKIESKKSFSKAAQAAK